MTRLHRVTHPEDGMVYACPECNAADVRERRQSGDPRGKDPEIDPGSPMVCYSCKTGVFVLKERKSRVSGHVDVPQGPENSGGIALSEMDVDEFDRHLEEAGLR